MRSNSAIEAHNSSLHGEENTEYATGSGEISLSTDGIEGFSVEIPIARITLPHVAIQGHLPEWSSPVLLGTPEVEAGVGIQGAHPGSLTALLEAGNHETSVRHMQPGMLWAAASGVERSNQDNSQTHQLPVVTDQSLALGSEFAEGNSKPALLQSSTGILQPSEIHTGGKGESTVGRTSASLRGAGEPATPAMQSPGSEQGAAVRSATSQTVATTAARATPVAVVRAEQLNAAIRTSQQQSRAEVSSPVALASELSPQIAPGSAPAVDLRTTAQQLPNPVGATAQLPDDAEATQSVRGVARGLGALAQQRGGTLLMRLDPPSLGTIRMEVSMEEGRVTVQIQAVSESARALLRGSLDVLRSAMEERGLAVERLVVDSGSRTTAEGSGRGEGREDSENGSQGEDRNDGKQDASQRRNGGRRNTSSFETGSEASSDFQVVLEDT